MVVIDRLRPGFRLENVSYNGPFHITDKITTEPRLISEYLLQNETNFRL